ncbi:MAG: hypothetical protein JXR96_17235 [Deltaproteobacteria bacterium]|nr:hypothetical protein [Deltaproteobacteria bacterium]
MLRWMLFALALVSLLALVVPSCGGGDGACRNGTFRCLGHDAQSCQDQKWVTFMECPDPNKCCMVDGFPTCSIHCIY